MNPTVNTVPIAKHFDRFHATTIAGSWGRLRTNLRYRLTSGVKLAGRVGWAGLPDSASHGPNADIFDQNTLSTFARPAKEGEWYQFSASAGFGGGGAPPHLRPTTGPMASALSVPMIVPAGCVTWAGTLRLDVPSVARGPEEPVDPILPAPRPILRRRASGEALNPVGVVRSLL
jgi:hypothetical protein